MQALINDLLQLSQVTSKRQLFKKVDLAKLSREVIEDLETRLIEPKASFILVICPVWMRTFFECGNSYKT
jgi:signal transduction histidine kinase